MLLSLARREHMSLVILSSRGTQSVGMAEGSEVPDPCSAADAESLLLTLRSSPLQPVSTSPLPVTLDPTVPSLMSPNSRLSPDKAGPAASVPASDVTCCHCPVQVPTPMQRVGKPRPDTESHGGWGDSLPSRFMMPRGLWLLPQNLSRGPE